MVENNYLVHPFHTANGFYIYDANTDSVIAVTKSIYKLFSSKGHDNTFLPEESDKKLLNRLQKKGFLLPCHIEEIEHSFTSYLPSFLDRKVQNLTLQITQACNLRCKYCVYSGEYNTRGHSSKSMTIGMAKKGIDFLFSHSTDTKFVDIGFYGGEPLLQFNMIKKIVQYAKDQGEGKQISFNMTTNGTIISDEIIDFLLANHFNILISLDGPKEIHDKNRVFATNGKGSFNTIIENIVYIKENSPELYSKISFSTVIDPHAKNSCSNNFFLNCSDIKGIPVAAGLINDEYRSSPISIPKHFFIQEEKDTFHMLLYKLGRLTDKTVPQITQNKFNQLNTSMFFQRQHKQQKLPSKLHHGGPCLPGIHKLFMDIYGNFFPCEKVSEGSLSAIIGNIETGFNLNKITNLLNIGKLTEEECKSCWNILLCSQCMISADDVDGLSKTKKLRACAKSKRINDKLLKDYCTLLEYGYKFKNSEIPLVEF